MKRKPRNRKTNKKIFNPQMTRQTLVAGLIMGAFKVPISRNYILIFGILAAQGIHILSMHLPFMQQILRVAPITFFEWFVVFILALPILLVMEIYKMVNNKLSGNYLLQKYDS